MNSLNNPVKPEPDTPDTIKNRSFVERLLGDDLARLETFPFYVNIETVNTCNARCIMCGIDFDNKPTQLIDDELFVRITEELGEWSHHVRKVNLFFDCEPLIDKKLHKRVKALKDAGIDTVTIATNASILSAKRSEELIEAGLDEVYISIDSMDPATFESIRVRLSYEDVYANTVEFIRLRDSFGGPTRIRLQMILQESNKDEQEPFVHHWREKLSPGDLVVVHKAHNWGGAVNVMNFEEDDRINSIPCTSLWSNAMIHVDGSVALCSVDTVQGSTHVLGNVNDGSLESVWTGPRMQEMRQKHLENKRADHPLCNGCTAWREDKNAIFLEIGKDD